MATALKQRDNDIRIAFGALFFAAHRLEVLIDRYLFPHGLTTKQFFLSLVLLQQAAPITLTETARKMGTSRQNVKQLALKLQERGFCTISPDPEDQRVLRLAITRENADFWSGLDDENVRLLRRLYREISDGTLHSTGRGLVQLLAAIESEEARPGRQVN